MIDRPSIGKETVRQVLERAGFTRIDLKDEQYELVPLDWLESIWDEVRQEMIRKVGNPEANLSVCHDYAGCAYQEIMAHYRRAPGRNPESRLAVARADYPASQTAGHQVLVLLFWAGPKNELDDIGCSWFDPQPRVSDWVATPSPSLMNGAVAMID